MNPSAQPLAYRGLRPVADLAKDRPHGDRLRYLSGCRCDECRRANTNYEKARAAARKSGDWNGIVSASRAQKHIKALSAHGIGRRAVGDVCGVAETTLVEIISGRKKNIRARTERAILAVTRDAAADRALIDASPTWKLLDELIANGYTKSYLAAQLGYKTRALQLNRKLVTVRNAYEVQRLFEKLRTVPAGPTLKRLDMLVDEGYTSRQIHDRFSVLAASLGIQGLELTSHKGQVRADTARVVERLYAQLTE